MSTHTDDTAVPADEAGAAARVLYQAQLAERALAQLEQANAKLQTELGPFIRAWENVEPVPCGHTGGWSLDTEHEDGALIYDLGSGKPFVRLRHDCFYAHRYDLHESHTTKVPLARLLAVKVP